MANIKVTSPVPVYDGQPLTFRSPADCSGISGLIVHYHDGKVATSKTFQFADAHGNNVGDYDLFATDALVKVILDTDTSLAFVQNADTNAYLEGRFDGKADKEHGNHVPATQTASNKKFLRNDNTWQEVTPANIGAAQVTTGSYEGTGTYGSSTKNKINILSSAKMLFVTGNENLMITMRGTTYGFVLDYATGSVCPIQIIDVSWGSSSVSWYANMAEDQMNKSGITYKWLTIC